MRVLHINCNYIGTALHRVMFRRLNQNGGHKVFVPSDGRESWKSFQPEADEAVAECFQRRDRYLFFKKQAQILQALEGIYDVSQFDCIHAYTLFTDGNCAMTLSEKYGIPYVVAVRNTDLNGFFKRRKLLYFRGLRILKNASAVFFLSQEYQTQLLDRYIPYRMRDSLLKKSYVIPNGIDPFWLENPAPPKSEEDLSRMEKGDLRLLFVGRINRYKNPTRAALAAEELCRRGYDVTFTAVGKVEEAWMLEEMEKGKSFTYLPPRPKEELLTIYRQNDMLVMPSHDETFGLVYPEAMTQGLPVIYSIGEGFYGQFPEGTVGYAVNPDRTESVVKMILYAAKYCRRIIPRCAEAARRFNWDDIIKRYEEIYRAVTGKE